MQQSRLYSHVKVSLLWTSLLLSAVTSFSRTPGPQQRVIMMAFDGFRPDYVNRGLTPTLKKIMDEGVSTDYLQNVFPTKTMTNFFSIATGMYAGTHGVLGNTVFNETLNCISYSDQLFHYNEDILPIWTLNELTGNGRHSGAMMWTSSQYEFRNITPTFYEVYNESMPWHERINKSMSWLLDDEKPVNLLCMYFEQPDSASHYYGVYSEGVNEQLRRVEEILEYFLQQLTIHNLEDTTNLIILSDHGMTDVDTNHTINVTQILDNNYSKCGSSPVLQIAPKPGKENETYAKLIEAQNRLKTFTVYKREEIPDRWHYKYNKRNTDYLLVADLPYAFDDETNKANHGYENAEKLMHAFFAAKGPMFRKKFHAPQIFMNIDIYALISYILELDPSLLLVKPDGTLSNIIEILDEKFSRNFLSKARRNNLKYFVPRTEVPRLIAKKIRD